MSTVTVYTDSAPDDYCPVCGLPGEGFACIEDGVFIATYLCLAYHVWVVKWLDPGAAPLGQEAA